MNHDPNIERILTSISLEEPDVVPLAELGIDRNIMKIALGKRSLSLEDVADFHARVACLDYVRVLADGRDFPLGAIVKTHGYSQQVLGSAHPLPNTTV